MLDVDATIVITHSEKELACADVQADLRVPPDRRVVRQHRGVPRRASCAPGEPGRTPPPTTSRSWPRRSPRSPPPYRRNLLIRCDGAGASHQLLDWLIAAGPSPWPERGVLRGVRDHREHPRRHHRWSPSKVLDAGARGRRRVREGGDVAELTGLLDPPGWPTGMRVIVRRERPHPGAQLSLFEERDGWRYQAFVTNTASGQLAVPRGPASGARPGRGPDPTRQGLRPGPVPVAGVRHQPDLADADQIAADLIAWTRMLALTGDAKILATASRRHCATASSMSRPDSPTAPAGDDCVYPRPGPGRRDRRGVRRTRRDPTTGLTPPPTTTRKPGEPQPGSVSRPTIVPRTVIDSPHTAMPSSAPS